MTFYRSTDGTVHGEKGELIIGHSSALRLLIVYFVETERRVRLISALKPTRHERNYYEENVSP